MQIPRIRILCRTVIATGLGLGLMACGATDSSGTAMPGMEHGAMATPPVAPTAPAAGAASSTMPMTDTSSPPPMDHGEVAALDEIPFIDGMIVHHQGAIAMASTAITQTKRPEVKQLAEAIVTAQDPEIQQLQGWRTQWYPSAPATDPARMSTMGMGEMDIGLDPTKEFDQRFLEAMISHHQGAVQMAQALHATHPELQAFADNVIKDQTAEIAQMQQWLKDWYGK